MFAWKNRKKLAAAVALFAVCGLLAGCAEDNHYRHHPHPHPESHPQPRHHPPHKTRHSDHHREHAHRPPPRDGRHHHGHRRHASLVGSYAALALNDALVPKGTEISLNVVQGNDDALRLVDPTGKQYPIQFDAETGVGYIAGGSLSSREDGNFVYEDASGGVWLVMRQ